MQSINIYDLDGTLNKLNSTFDFIKMYHKEKGNFLRIFFLRLFSFFLRFLPTYFYRRVLIFITFFGIKEESLNIFYERTYKDFFYKNFTELGLKVKEKDNSKNILLTGCTDIPAIKIAKEFGFNMVIFTELFYYKDICLGVMKVDSFADRKKELVESYFKENNFSFKNTIYYTDDTIGEKELCKLFKEVKYV